MSFYAPNKRTPRPLTWERDRHIRDWDKEDPQSQAKDRALKQKNGMREDVEEHGEKNGST